MKGILYKNTILLLLIGIFIFSFITLTYGQGLSLEKIRLNLLNNPPYNGDPVLREQTILDLDNILKNDSSRTSSEVINFYNLMMEKVNTEINQPITSGISIWMMYNHGFIVKTPQLVFAFDLINGYEGWQTLLPDELINEIKVLFISHVHLDHFSLSIAEAVMANGGYVVVPYEFGFRGNTPMAAGDSLLILGLNIKAYDGLHSTPGRIYYVSTSSGIRIMHTGDNQTSETLPNTDCLDVLLLNAWVNESGQSSAVVGMRNSINKLTPIVMVPGHIQELFHDYTPGSSSSRVPYEWAFEVDDIQLPSLVQVMAWGEQYLYPEQPVEVSINLENIPAEFKLKQNYPNPFNPATIIGFGVREKSNVKITILNSIGEEVGTLLNENKEPGFYQVEFNASNLPSGIYFYQLRAGNFVETKKMILLK
ncbi:MAG: T9SS type A sorting domain-containing protein [Ignavibacteriaceae bacterium]